MIGQATAHRRANAFAQALEDQALEDTAAVPGEAPGEHAEHGAHAAHAAHGAHAAHAAHAAPRHADPEQAAMLAFAASLSSRSRPVMDAEKKTVQRAQLIAAMEQALADGSFDTAGRVPEQRTDGHGGHRATGTRGHGPRSRLSRRLAAGGLTVGVAAGAFGGVAAASTNALPGDTLYGLKRGMEDLKLDLAGNDASRGKVYLDMAATRMQEARRLTDRGRGGRLDDESVGEVRKALSGMHQEATEGHRLLSQAYRKDGSLQSIALLNTFTESHRQGWSDLRGKLPSQLTDLSDQVSSLFDAIDQEVAPLESLLPKPKGSGTPSPSHGSGPAGSGDSSGGPTSGTGPASPSASPTTGGQASPGSSQSPIPAPSSSSPEGLIGGSLLSPPSPTPSTSGTPTSTVTTPSRSVILPPLLPGLLPDLDLGGTNDDQ